MWRDALVVAGKDLRVEGRSKVALNQVVPYSLVVLLLFGFAFDQDQPLLVQAAPGFFWLAVLFSGLLAVQRTFSVESADGAADSLRMSGLEPAGIFVGKVVAVAVQLLLLEVFLAVGIVVLFHSKLAGAGLLAASAFLSTAGVAAAGSPTGRFRWAPGSARRCCRSCSHRCSRLSYWPLPRRGGRPWAFPPGTVGVGSACSPASPRSTWLAEC